MIFLFWVSLVAMVIAQIIAVIALTNSELPEILGSVLPVMLVAGLFAGLMSINAIEVNSIAIDISNTNPVVWMVFASLALAQVLSGILLMIAIPAQPIWRGLLLFALLQGIPWLLLGVSYIWNFLGTR